MFQHIDWNQLAAVLGSLATAASVVFAYYQYKSSSEEKFFSEFRLSLIDLRNDLREFDSTLSESEFSDIGYQISVEIDDLFEDVKDKNKFIDKFCDNKNHDLIIQAIYVGQQKSNVKSKILDLTRKIERVSPKYRESFPVSMSALQDVVSLYTSIGSSSVNPSLFIQNWINEDIRSAISSELRKSPDRKSACRQIGIIFSSMSTSTLKRHGQGVIDSLSEIVDVMISTLIPVNDATLRNYSNRQKKLKSRLTVIDKPTITEDIQDKLQLIRSEFDDGQWVKVVAANATVTAQYKKISGD